LRIRRRSFIAWLLVFGCVGVGAPAGATTDPPNDLVAPLTGLPVGDEATVGRPALVIPIDNWGEQGPHAGLNAADLVFEMVAEGQVTRMLAVFNSQDADPVGPIRSGRTQDVLLFGCLNNPLFAHSGGNQGVIGALRKIGWTVLDQSDPSYFRSDEFGNGAPHNLYANTSELWARAGDSGAAAPQFDYLPTGEEIDGPEVGEVEIQFASHPIVWTWHAGTGRYLRSQFGHVHETDTGQVTATTVIVITAPYRDSPAAAGSPEAQTVGSGDAVVYANGRRVAGTWTRESPTSVFTLEANGEPVLIPPGRTWIEVVDVANYELTES
jgi:hypothetical protein